MTTTRPARPEDVPALHGLVLDLARYEREPDAVEASTADLHEVLFGAGVDGTPRVHCLVAETDGPDGPVVGGMAVWFVSYSTWRGRHGIWLEDLVVREDLRGRGLGRALLSGLAAECVRRGWARLEWSVLDWNASAIGFYRSLGARAQDGWTTWRLDGAALAAAGSQDR